MPVSMAVPKWAAGDFGIDGPMARLSLPVPAAYSAAYGTYNTEFAYGTPIYFSAGWRGYKYWMAAAPYPASSSGASATITNASPAVVTTPQPPPANTAVNFSTTGTLPTGLSTGVTYYVSATGYAEGSIQVSATPGGASINTSSAGSGTHTMWYIGGQVTISQAAPGVMGCASSPNPGVPVIFATSGALPTGLVAGNIYFVSATGWTSTTFSVATTPSGTPITTTSAGSGVHTFNIFASKFENPYVLVSNDGVTWAQPTGIATNPISDVLGALATGTDAASYYADPYIVASTDQTKLYICWHWFSRGGTNKSTILVSESSDGLTWSAPVEISNSTSTSFTPNSVSLIPTATGWTMVAIDTAAATQPYIYSKTTSSTPYTGWTAPGTVYSGEWTQCTATHPLTRKWWHQHTIPIDGGGFLSLASDNASAGGTAWSLISWDGGATWSVSQFSALKAAAAGGNWYRPSLCAINDAGSQSLQLFASTISWPKAPNTLTAERGPLGYYVHTAKIQPKASQASAMRAFVRDAVNRNLAAPAVLNTSGLVAWDSFNRADGAVGNAESGQTWTVGSGTWAILTNRLSCSVVGNITIDLGVSNYDVEFSLVTLNANLLFLFGYVDASNHLRWGTAASSDRIDRVVGGAVTYGINTGISQVAGDTWRISKRGPYYNFFLNDRLMYSYYDTLNVSSTIVGFRFGAGAIIDNFIAYRG